MAKKGRPRKSAARTANGRLSQAYDYGNERCIAKMNGFRHDRILDGKAAWIDIYDGVGQLHAVGMFDGLGLDGKLLREAGRDYVGLYNHWYVDLMPKGSDLERAYGGRTGSGKSDLIPQATKREARFSQMDQLLPMGSDERYWTHKLLLDHFGLDTVLPLVDRLVNYRFNQWGLPLPTWNRDMRSAGAVDFQTLGHILRGLYALADGVTARRLAA
ncbi:MAG: hypothetical protein JWR80_9468 [Bradyrhizobium sp.]|nr:hypothetical protein [Bradyrhizobium sp.]